MSPLQPFLHSASMLGHPEDIIPALTPAPPVLCWGPFVLNPGVGGLELGGVPAHPLAGTHSSYLCLCRTSDAKSSGPLPWRRIPKPIYQVQHLQSGGIRGDPLSQIVTRSSVLSVSCPCDSILSAASRVPGVSSLVSPFQGQRSAPRGEIRPHLRCKTMCNNE